MAQALYATREQAAFLLKRISDDRDALPAWSTDEECEAYNEAWRKSLALETVVRYLQRTAEDPDVGRALVAAETLRYLANMYALHDDFDREWSI